MANLKLAFARSKSVRIVVRDALVLAAGETAAEEKLGAAPACPGPCCPAAASSAGEVQAPRPPGWAPLAWAEGRSSVELEFPYFDAQTGAYTGLEIVTLTDAPRLRELVVEPFILPSLNATAAPVLFPNHTARAERVDRHPSRGAPAWARAAPAGEAAPAVLFRAESWSTAEAVEGVCKERSVGFAQRVAGLF